jgi:hypothetical protein
MNKNETVRRKVRFLTIFCLLYKRECFLNQNNSNESKKDVIAVTWKASKMESGDSAFSRHPGKK